MKDILNFPKKHKCTGSYTGSLITFQHYLNMYNCCIPSTEQPKDSTRNLYQITEWYKNGILVKILIEKDKNYEPKYKS